MATILKALITGVMPPMDPADEREHEALFKMLDEKGQLFEIQQQQRAYDQRKASGLDNAQKNSAVLSSIGVAIVAVIALVNAQSSTVRVLGMISVMLMAISIVVAHYMVMPKLKNWVKSSHNENTKLRSLKALRAATQPSGNLVIEGTSQRLFHYMEAVRGEYHWNYLLMIERREFGLVCALGIAGVILTVIALFYM